MSTNASVSSSTHPSTLDAERQDHAAAVDRFRTRMAAANRGFFKDRISEIDARGLATEKERICLMQRWRRFKELDRDETASHSNPAARHTSNRFRQTRELAAVPRAAGRGHAAPDVFQQQAEEWATAEGEDFASEPPFPARDQYKAQVRRDCAWLRERLETEHTSDLINKAKIPACPDWYSAYLYCRKGSEEDMEGIELPDEGISDAPQIREWVWRVVFMEHEATTFEPPQVLYGRRPRFDSIPEFLDWYTSWPDSLDGRGLRSLRRHVEGCETDCESDCEDHNLYL
ncbi:uncharacterized protein BP01DRAFT_412885 [Aspergillus saccharolyticus JOP 1030-1]|uniref:Uncharacterized protein n=1 Tax=Aspergillus saccharolyticus JOP 1030-1 TaxID=1450539 RepID=A0A318ZSH2_9EURO|nr:hypothetical protein BP01DRAFT_412885 [Aspergillus saccharolyticus JOP 1030-1]PYH50077.1 hypothetical protein BP01DRAFT_412885 [Aspergillus saccharolyticus JOP 1030-1]